MELCAPHGRNKVPSINTAFPEALHKYVLDTALGGMLRKWREHHGLPQSAQLSLYSTYLSAWRHSSPFCIWCDAWELLPGPQRVQFSSEMSLVFPVFSLDMLQVVYSVSCRGAYHMQQSFLAYAASWMVPLASLGGLMLLVFWAEVVHCSLHVLYAVLMPGKLLWAPTVSAWAWLSQLLCHCLMTCRIALELILRAVAVESLRLQGLLRRPRMDPPWKSQLRWRQEGVPDLGECACGLEPPCIERGLHVDHRHRDRSVTLPFLGQLRRLKKLLRRDPNAAPSTRMRLYGERMPGDAAWSLSGLVRIAALEERPWRGTEPRTERLPLLKWLAQRRPGNRRTLRRILSRRTFDEMSKDAGWRIPPLRCLRSLLGLRRRLVMHHLHGPHDLLKMREKVKRRKEQRMRTIMNRLAFAVRTPATMAWGLACKLKTDLMAMAGLENFRMQGWILYVHAALLPGLSYYMIVMIRQVLYLLLPVNIQLNTHDVRGVLRWQQITAPFIEVVPPEDLFVLVFVPSPSILEGVAILVREALCRTGELHYQEVVPGRLLHVRVEQEHHSLDILGVYQHALHLEAGKNNLPQRQKVWDKLGALLHNLSRRNMLVLLGDYNCTPEYVTGAMGHSYDKASNYPDANEFAALLESHDLVLLNGWVRRSQQFTFTGSKHKSIIDFVITRRHHADGQAPGCWCHSTSSPRLGMVVLALQLYAQQCRSHTALSSTLRGPGKTSQYLEHDLHSTSIQHGGRQARRTLLTNELAAAAEAAQRNDTGQLHRIIRRLAPKSKRVQVRIHGPNGEMLRDSAEHEAIVSYFEDLFQSQTAPLPISPGLDAAPQVSEQEVYDSLRSTKYGKAVPPSTPSSAIKCCADLLAQAITPAVNECLQGELRIPVKTSMQYLGQAYQGYRAIPCAPHSRMFGLMLLTSSGFLSGVVGWVNRCRCKSHGTVRTPRPKASPCERVSSGPVEPVVRGPYIVLGIAVVSFISSAYFGTRIFRIFNSSLLWKPGPALKMEGSGEAALTEVRSMFPHLAPPLTTAADQEMAPAPLLGRRDRQEEAGETPEKFPRPAGKGQNPLPGKASTAEAPTPNNAPPPAATAAPSTPPKGKEEGRTNRGRTRQWTQEEWDSWTNWSTNNKELSNKELQREVEYLKENVRLLARISMRHEDELSQKRTETDFILTLEVAPPNATPEQEGLLEQLYKMTVEWKKLQEQGKVNNSLRLTLFIGLLMYYELKVQEATASADTVERLAQLGYIRQLDGNPVWNYLRWNYDKEELEPSDQPPLSDTELRSLLTVLKTSIGAPGVLIRFHSSRKLVEQHKTAVTVFLGIGMRDPQALICYRALQQLSYNASTQLVKMRLKPVRMERQPLVKVLQEKFPAPPTRTEEQRVTFLAKAQQQWRKGKGRGRGGQQETQKPSDQTLEAAAAAFRSQ
ncbi:hypothetical protein AK812_SmicGene42749 [Symbiodinium microadriaticum]|uniref:Endonuclease/exonuclease/phosphatase domain-containing protein n=1 Tax=Symbiodinium microadriaticum TaxID=2951 RepID=A0A1Q9C2R8_SYMMI|nr:hypothetical protein AK812_SmicGene42749 [Symbiodinium microadriaticum]